MAVLAVLLLSAGLTLSLARGAIAQALTTYTFSCKASICGTGFPRDSDGSVPESVGDLNGYIYGDDWTVYGSTSWYSVYPEGGGRINRDSIKYDWRATDTCGVPRYKVSNHEHAHARGWGHGYGTPDRNAAYYAQVQPCAV